MENKRPYGRRKTDENRQTQPKTRRPYEKDEREKRPVRKTFTGKPTTGRPFTDKPRNYSPKPKKKAEAAEDDGLVRLNKFIANSGICSRREADTYIETGLVTVNGERVTELGTKIDPVRDDIRFNGQRIRGEKKVYLVMNKPKDFVTTLSDPHADKTVMDLISKSLCPERVFPVGRLDKATTGVLLLTNDGDLTEKLTHPKHEVRKIYHATLDKNLKKEDFDKILEGIELEDGPIAADALSYVEGDKSQVGLEIHSGRNRIVRRLFEHLGYKVKKLDRVYFAGLTKKNLRRGAWRFLEEKEIALLKMGAFQ
jgi:23S rRNA pseudouridine2605 synthase